MVCTLVYRKAYQMNKYTPVHTLHHVPILLNFYRMHKRRRTDQVGHVQHHQHSKSIETDTTWTKKKQPAVLCALCDTTYVSRRKETTKEKATTHHHNTKRQPPTNTKTYKHENSLRLEKLRL
jgi:hypothetical protein